jgi:hypothetical protein
MNLLVFFPSQDNVAKIMVEVHLVDYLPAQLLLGVDAIGREGFRVDFETLTVRIASCIGFSFPVNIHAKPKHQQ